MTISKQVFGEPLGESKGIDGSMRRNTPLLAPNFGNVFNAWPQQLLTLGRKTAFSRQKGEWRGMDNGGAGRLDTAFLPIL